MVYTELETKVKNLSGDYIYHQAIGSMLLLLMSNMEQEVKEQSVIHLTIHEDVKKIEQKIQDYVLDLEDILDGERHIRAHALDTCFSLKKELLSIYEIVYSYFSQWNIVSTLVADQVAVRKYSEDQLTAKKVDYSLFYGDCHGFLETATTTLEQKQRMSQLLKCAPLFMTRDKFYDTVRQSLNFAFTGESKELIDVSLHAFEGFSCPKANPLYGKYFPEIAAWIGAKSLLLPQKLSDEELADEYEDMNTTFELLKDIEEYFSCILHDINSLIMLFYLTYSFAESTQKDVAYADLYHAVCDYISGEYTDIEKTALLDTINEQLEQVTEVVIDEANEIAKKEIALLEKAGSFDGFSDETTTVLMTEQFIRNCFFGDLNDELFHFDVPENLPMATDSEKNALFDAFLSHTRSTFETLPVQTRKIAMQTLQGALPPVYQVDEFMELLTDGMDRLSTDEQRLLVIDKVGMIFHDAGYESITNDPHEHTHHEHGPNCGCGHDHHHEHGPDCGCGHDHHDHDHKHESAKPD